MRKFEQKQLLELIDTMKTANSALENLFSAGNMAEFQEILASEQAAAVSIGTTLEETVPNTDADAVCKVTETVHLLEEYCELLWNTNQAKSLTEVKEYHQKLNDYTEKIEQAIAEAPIRLEVVFMPYKASMWDCMETVWMAANEDLDCDAYVIPIPYFDVKDGQAQEMHYEADMMPAGIPITDFREYSLEERRPDVIYIHNPFDGYNKVSSVHPSFYCAELKKYTDMLVYIPYYITDGRMPEGHLNIPSYQIIDKIILQNEKMVEQFDEVLRDKLLVLGNPKVDRILRLEKEKEEIIHIRISEEWKKKIQGKKVVLYNTSISGILENSKTALDKIKEIIGKFSGRDDVVLLWRPHPLSETTLKSMRPEMYQKYMDIKNDFIKEGKGIFDETGDAGISATIADAYIGENTSSLVHYFGLNGKPVLFTQWQTITDATEDKRKSLYFTDAFFEGNYMYFVPRSTIGYNYLCRMNLESGTVELYRKLLGEFQNPVKGNAYFGICKNKNKILLSPVWSSEIYLYDLDTDQAIKIPLRDDTIQGNFTKVYAYNDSFVLQPRNYPDIVIVDMLTGKCEYFPIPNVDKRKTNTEFLFGLGSCVVDKKLFIPYTYKNEIVVFDLQKQKFENINIADAKGGFYSVASDGERLWMIGNESLEIGCYNLKSGNMKIINNPLRNFEGGKQPFREIISEGGKMLLFPENGSEILEVDKKDYTLKVLDCDYYPKRELYYLVKNYEDNIIALVLSNSELIMYDYVNKQRKKIKVRLEKKDLLKLEAREWRRFFQNDNVPCACSENEVWSLSSYLDYVTGKDFSSYNPAKMNYENVVVNLNEGCGKNIHKNIVSNTRHII